MIDPVTMGVIAARLKNEAARQRSAAKWFDDMNIGIEDLIEIRIRGLLADMLDSLAKDF